MNTPNVKEDHRHRYESRSSPYSMGVQTRVVSATGHIGPWVEDPPEYTNAWKAYKKMRKAQELTKTTERGMDYEKRKEAER